MTSPALAFEVLIHESFTDFVTDKNLTPIEKKTILSLVNDFEDTKWRFDKFENFIWDNVAETALTYTERLSLVGNPSTILSRSAKNLRLTDKDDKISSGSELAEIVLYGIMKQYYNALPVVPKIHFKQNSNDNAKGADSVHIILEQDDDFTIWFGEAKFYNSIEDTRLGEIITSVENSLLTEKLRKENSIIVGLSELDHILTDGILLSKIKAFLAQDQSMDLIKPKLHIPILLLYQCEITSKQETMNEKYKKEVLAYQKKRAESYFTKQIGKLVGKVHLYEEISFHVILFPVPTKKYITDNFLSSVKFFKK